MRIDLFPIREEEIVVIDADRVVLFVNRPVLERLGTSLDRVVGAPCHLAFGTDPSRCLSPEEECPLKRVLESGHASSTGCRQDPSDPQEHPVAMDSLPLRDTQGRLTAVICLPRSLPPSRRDDRFLDTMGEGVALVSGEGRIVEANPALCLMLGLAGHELAGCNLADFIAPGFELAPRDSAKGGSPSMQLSLARKDGSLLDAEVAVSPLSPSFDSLHLMFVADRAYWRYLDESVAEQVQAAVKSVARYKAIFEASNDALLLIEDDTTISRVNRRFEEITGYHWHEVEGKMSFLPLVCDEHRDQALTFHDLRRERSLAGQPRHRMWLATKSGQRWLAEVSGGMIPETRRSFVALRDVTEVHVLQQEVARRNREIEALHSIAALLSRSADLGTMLNHVLDAVAAIIGEFQCAIYLLDEERQILLLTASNRQAVHGNAPVGRLSLGEGPAGNAAKSGRPLFTGGTIQDARMAEPAAADFGLGACAFVPLISSGRVRGVMSVSRPATREFSPDEQHLLTTIGNEVGVAVERLQHLDKARDRARESSSLMLVTQEIASTLDLQRVLDRTLSFMCVQVWADQGGIGLFDETSGELVAKSLWGEESFLPSTVWKLGQGVAGWAAAHQSPVICDDLAADSRFDFDISASQDYHSMIAVPLKVEDKMLGVAVLASRRIGAFATSHLRLLTAYAAQASLALEKALLYQRVKDEASSLAAALGQLAVSENRFRALIENSSDSILVLNAAGEITYASPSTSRISGYAPDRLMGVNAIRMIDPEDRDDATRQFRRLLADSGYTIRNEFRTRSSRGQMAWIEMTATNLLEEPGVQGIVVNWRDISTRKQVEKERERLITILEATPDIVAICGLNAGLLYANRAARAALKAREHDDLSSRTITELVHDQSRTRFSDEIIPAVIRDGRWTGEINARGSNGQETAALLVAQAHRAPGGGIGFLSMIARDITELKRVNGELKVAAEQWQTTFDGITEGIILLDGERRVLRCNSAMQAFLGLPPQEILGRSCCDLVCGLSTTERDCTSVRAIETRHKATTIRQIAGRWFAITVYPMEDRDRALDGIVYIMSDISEQEKAKESLQESEKKIRQLAEASVRAQEEERQWVADEVHDRIAQTLVAVHQQLQALRSAGESGLPTRRQVDRALELQQMAIHETRNIMKDLYSPTLERYGLVAVIQEELRQLRDDLGLQTGIDARCPERPPKHVEGVLYRIIHEALMNVKKHGQGATRVDVSIAWEHDDVGIVVQDDGPGFDISAVTADKHFGGMVAMRRRAEIIGGTFEVKSSPGKGARVTASVPSRHTKSA